MTTCENISEDIWVKYLYPDNFTESSLKGKKIHIFKFKYFWNFKNFKKMSFYVVLKLLICEYTDVSLQQEYENMQKFSWKQKIDI